jgi:hypothetical protein
MRPNEVSMDMQGMNPRQVMGTVRVYIHIIALKTWYSFSLSFSHDSLNENAKAASPISAKPR